MSYYHHYSNHVGKVKRISWCLTAFLMSEILVDDGRIVLFSFFCGFAANITHFLDEMSNDMVAQLLRGAHSVREGDHFAQRF